MEELELEKGIPVQVTPTKASLMVQNTMASDDDKLMVSSHGDVNKKWVEVQSLSSVKITEPMYFMQDARAVWVFPVIESD
jgi:hypothetical protein